MLSRRILDHAALALAGCVALSVSENPASANALSSEQISQELLEACDARAKPFGRYDDSVAQSVDALTEMGVFSAREIQSVKIGYCELRRANGPAGTTSCAQEIILLDSGYAANDRSIVRAATLAHEIKHVLQHRAHIARHGDGYCESDQYIADKGWMEVEADAFGDGVAELFFAGRAVEIKNECPVSVSIYLEADKPMPVAGDAVGFIEAPPLAVVHSPERAMSRFFKVYAKTEAKDGERKLYGGATMATKRDIAGKTYGLESVALSNADPSKGPFQMTLSCDQQ